MKVYELMSQLDDMPAGAEVRISLTRGESEMCLIDEIAGEKIYSVSVELKSTEEDGDGVVLSD